MAKNNQGMTLMETLVSIVIVGVIGTFMLIIFADKSKIDAKTISNYNIGELLKSDFEMFSYDPEGYKSYYMLRSGVETKVYYNKKFDKKSYSTTPYYLVITYLDKEDNDGYYQIDVEVYVDNVLRSFNGVTKLTRSVYEK